jgi:hypothetical protein
MDVHIGHCFFDGHQDIAVVIAIHIAGQAPLHTHFCGSPGARLEGALLDFIETEKIGVRRPSSR